MIVRSDSFMRVEALSSTNGSISSESAAISASSSVMSNTASVPLRPVRSGISANQCRWQIVHGDALHELRQLPRGQFDCIVTSPPYYWQRDYGVGGQLGKEPTIDEYVAGLVRIMAEAKHVLSPTGLLFLNLGDTYYSG